MGAERVRRKGTKIENEIRQRRIPFVESVHLDDFASNEGRIVVILRMEKSMGKYFFGAKKSPLRKISAQLRSAVNSVDNVRLSMYSGPEATYETSFGMKEFDGYDTNMIMMDFLVYGEDPQPKRQQYTSPEREYDDMPIGYRPQPKTQKTLGGFR